jgi:hypothetical protein
VPRQPATFAVPRVRVPYTAEGLRDRKGPGILLDLTVGQSVRVSKQNNIKGARQPMYKSVTCATVGKVAEVTPHAVVLNMGSATMRLGRWWIDAAARGAIEHLPIINA